MDKIISDLKAYYQDIKPHIWTIAFFTLASFLLFILFGHISERAFYGFIIFTIWTPFSLSTYYWRKPRNLGFLEAMVQLKAQHPTIFYSGVFVFLVTFPIFTSLR